MPCNRTLPVVALLIFEDEAKSDTYSSYVPVALFAANSARYAVTSTNTTAEEIEKPPTEFVTLYLNFVTPLNPDGNVSATV